VSGLKVIQTEVKVAQRTYSVYCVVPQGGEPLRQALICFHGWVGNFQNQQYFGPDYLQQGLRYDWIYVFPQDREGVWRGGSWWLGEGNSGAYEQVLDHIFRLLHMNFGIAAEDVAFWGSSMGGYGALYHGLKRQVPYIMVNVPQTNLFDEEYWDHAGTFLKGVFTDIQGPERGRLCYPESDLTTLIGPETGSLIDIETARFDLTPNYFENQVLRFCTRLSDYGVNFRLCVNPVQMHGIIATPCEAARRWHGWQGQHCGGARYDHARFASENRNTAQMIEAADLFE